MGTVSRATVLAFFGGKILTTLILTTELSSIEARSNDGRGNNLANPDWGIAGGTYIRVTDVTYGTPDGTSWPYAYSLGGDLPETADVSTKVFGIGAQTDTPNSYGVNEHFQFFGQFLAHDISQAKPGTTEPIFETAGPVPLTRDAYVLDDFGMRQTVTSTTSYVDLSQVYGKSDAVESLLRKPGSAKLLLRADDTLPSVAEVAAAHGADAQAILPMFQVLPISADLPAAGDERVFQSPQLASIHAVWARNHNYHVENLTADHPDWTVDQIFESARILNEAEYQNIVFNEYVNKLYGTDALGSYSGYSDTVDASIINEFTTIANRFGHDQASDGLIGLDEAGREVFTKSLAEAIAETGAAIASEDQLNAWIRGQLAQSSQEIDGKVVPSAGNLEIAPGIVFDLKALDIARGRDHGVNDYNLLREGLGLSTYASFDAFAAAHNVDGETVSILKTVYNDDISKLDSLVGGLLEKDVPGSQLGETFTKLGIQQMQNLRDGDRFYFEERFKDMPDLLGQIKDVTMADIIARTTSIEHVYRDGFAAHDRIGGTSGNDHLTGTKDADLISGFDGDDHLYGKSGEDDLYGGAGRDLLSGGFGDDLLKGGADADTIFGGKGDDVIDGGEGNDRLWGGRGADTFVFSEGSGADRIIGFNKHEDKIDLSAYGFSSFEEVQAATSSLWFFSSSIDLGGGNEVKVYGLSKWSMSADDFVYADTTEEPELVIDPAPDDHGSGSWWHWGGWGSWHGWGGWGSWGHHDHWA